MAQGAILTIGSIMVTSVAVIGIYSFGGIGRDSASEDTASLQTPQKSHGLDGTPSVQSDEQPARAGEEDGNVSATGKNVPEADDTPAVTVLRPPSFDIVRIARDGTTVIGGRGAPGSVLEVLLDEETVAELAIDTAGAFAKVLTIEPSQSPRMLSLVMDLNGDRIPSDDTVIIAPFGAHQDAQPEPDMPSDELVIADVGQANAADGPLAQEDSPAIPERAEVPEAIPPQAGPTATPVTPEVPDLFGLATEMTTQSDNAALPLEEPAVLSSTREGLRLVQPTGSEKPSELMMGLSIDTISYSDTGHAKISGRGGANLFVRLYVDNIPNSTLRIATDGNWSGTLRNVDAGVYTLRVDQINESGEVLSRVETPFKREKRQALTRMLEQSTHSHAPSAGRVVVQRGNTLWGLARQNYGEGILYVKLFEANQDNIRDPDLIYPGQVFMVPD